MPKRTICIPVAEVIDGGTKAEFYASLRAWLNTCVKIANIATSECVKQDDLTKDRAGKIYVYPQVKDLAGPGASIITSCVSRAATSAYIQNRFKVMRGTASLRLYRSFPYPLLHNASTKHFRLFDEGEFLTAELKLGDKTWKVRLSGGSNYRDQVSTLRKQISGESYGDSKIWIDGNYKAILGICCEIEKRERGSLSGEMLVSSSRDHLITCTLPRSTTPWVINVDHAKTWQSAANQKYARLRQDRKSGVNRKILLERSNQIQHKQHARMAALCHDVSSLIVKRAIKARCKTIRLDLTIKSYIKTFPWAALKEKIRYKAEDAQIEVLDESKTLINPELAKPHVYFKYAPTANRVKIGMTAKDDGSRHGAETDSPEELIILAIENCPKTKLRAREKHWQAYFDSHRDRSREKVREWFFADPIIDWLREVGWLGNSGNLSQIAQFLDVSQELATSKANSDCLENNSLSGCSQNAAKGEDIAKQFATALAVSEASFNH